MTDKAKSIDESINKLETYIDKNRKSAKSLLLYLFYFTTIVISFIIALYFYISPTNLIPNATIYGLFALYIIVFGVLISIYRFHLNEIARTEHYKMGFMRIRIAANNVDNKGFGSEVRIALTKDAFAYTPATLLSSSKDKKIDSPLSGYPTSDISTAIINKLFEKIEIKEKKFLKK